MAKSSTGSKGKPTASTNAKASVTTEPGAAAPLARLTGVLGLAEVPRPVQTAVKLMLGGAIATLAWGIYDVIVDLAFRSDVVNEIAKADKITLTKAASYVNSDIFGTVIFVVAYAAAWVLMARMNRAGRNWARIVSTLLFLYWTYILYQSISSLSTDKSWFNLASIVIQTVIWCLGCGALVSLWRPEAGPHFARQADPAAQAKWPRK